MTDCIWRTIKSGDLTTYRCPKCKRTHQSKYPPELIHRNCIVPTHAKRGGPGTILARVLRLLQIKAKRGCGCQDWAAWMDTLGWRGCWRERKAICARLLEATRYNR